ncbi:BgTH12-06465 [Blumeria graminis f. sp. triticale]|uniref:Bgt-984 n=3 Tax=Blumeria graminis TaxID=34373 RepID=A0A061HDH7_BLUGR|nr:Sphinganine C4-hydroxylase [Blumeria graminis f. sp. tritici 96224]CAD6500758.1 BgTH12-06465 [Blumeria graminis f. sp. triticale]VCU41034.1 Bgt-984 [Blumeria graminis f. sp. tritici]
MLNVSEASRFTDMYDLPPLPSYTLSPVEPLFFIPDFYLTLFLPVVVYWIFSMFFHLIDIYDIWPQYRIHTPVEILKRNRVSRYEVARDVIIQQIIQILVATVLNLMEPEQTVGKEEYEIACWATVLRLAQRALPQVFALFGLNASAISKNISQSHPMLAGALSGGRYSFRTMGINVDGSPSNQAFAHWELAAASIVYWYIVPAFQFLIAVIFVDTWQYFLHRAMHVNKWLYTTCHSRHHRLYVPYAYGALYNHPFEGFLLDTLGAGLGYKLAGMTARQGMVFFVVSTLKTVDDHCGYALPWDPLQHITSNNASYHDIHHQSWGIKTNFSQPFFTFWDGFLGTMWTGGRTTRYSTKKSAKIRS